MEKQRRLGLEREVAPGRTFRRKWEGLSGNDFGRPGHVLHWVMVGIVILVALWFAVSLASMFMHPMQGMYYPFYHPFFFPFGFLFGIFMIFIVFGALRWVFMPWGWRHRRRRWQYRDESYYILRERYAKGEITKEQYEQMTRDLQKEPPHP